MKKSAAFFLGALLLGLASLVAAFPLWLDSPQGRKNPHDPKSPLFNSTPAATPTPPNTATISPTFTVSPTYTASPSATRTPLPAGTPVVITIKNYQGTPVPGALVMLSNDTGRTGLTNASGQTTINSMGNTFTAFFFSPQDGLGNPILEPLVIIAADLAGNTVTQGGVFRPRPVPVWGDIILNSVSNTSSPGNTLLVTWQCSSDSPLGSAQYVPLSALPVSITKVARDGRAQIMLVEIDPAGTTLAAAWIPLTYTASGVTVDCGLGSGFVLNNRTYSAYAPVDSRLTTFRGFLLPFNSFGGEFLPGLGALNPAPSQFLGWPQSSTDLFPMTGAGNHHPTMAAWGASGGEYYFSWQLFQTGTNDDFNPSPFYLRPPTGINSLPSGTDSFQTTAGNASDFAWTVISQPGPQDYPEFFPENEVMRLFKRVAVPTNTYNWDMNIQWPAGISPALYGLQTGQNYKITVGDTNWYDYSAGVAGGLLYILSVGITSKYFTR